LAFLAWGADPSLTAAEVKQIIVSTAHAYGKDVVDHRQNITLTFRERTYHQVHALSAVEVALGIKELPPIDAYYDIIVLLDDSFLGFSGGLVLQTAALSLFLFPHINDYDRVAVFTTGHITIGRHSRLYDDDATQRDNAWAIIQGLRENTAQGNWRGIYDSVLLSLFEFALFSRPNAERVVILLTNGEESVHVPEWSSVRDFANTIGIRVYTVGIHALLSDNPQSGVPRLRRIASETGGRFFGAEGYYIDHMHEILDRNRVSAFGLGHDLDSIDIMQLLKDLGLYEYYRDIYRDVPEAGASYDECAYAHYRR
jgi:hypothetical protein